MEVGAYGRGTGIISDFFNFIVRAGFRFVGSLFSFREGVNPSLKNFQDSKDHPEYILNPPPGFSQNFVLDPSL